MYILPLDVLYLHKYEEFVLSHKPFVFLCDLKWLKHQTIIEEACKHSFLLRLFRLSTEEVWWGYKSVMELSLHKNITTVSGNKCLLLLPSPPDEARYSICDFSVAQKEWIIQNFTPDLVYEEDKINQCKQLFDNHKFVYMLYLSHLLGKSLSDVQRQYIDNEIRNLVVYTEQKRTNIGNFLFILAVNFCRNLVENAFYKTLT